MAIEMLAAHERITEGSSYFSAGGYEHTEFLWEINLNPPSSNSLILIEM
jgi:hypothetical protein